MSAADTTVRQIGLRTARSAAGRFTAATAGRSASDRADALRRVRAAQRTLQPREARFAHLKAAHD